MLNRVRKDYIDTFRPRQEVFQAMFDRFSERARKVLSYARQEAERLNHDYIGTEHILLGLCREGTCLGVRILRGQNVNPDEIHKEVLTRVQKGRKQIALKQLPFTDRAKKILEFAILEAIQLDNNHVGTEHLMLGVLREEEGFGAQTLHHFGLTIEKAREELVHLLDQHDRNLGAPSPPDPDFPVRGFTDRAEKTMQLAIDAARNLGQACVGTEHLLLGLAAEGAGVAANALVELGASLERLLQLLNEQSKAKSPPVALPLSPGTEKAVEMAYEEARKLEHAFVGTEHLLLGLLHDKEGGAAKALEACGIELDAVRKEVMEFLGMDAEQA